MNFLAHMLCSSDAPLSKLGNFLADFVKGDVEGRFPREVVAGIRHHRRADHFTDSHEVFGASRRLISGPRRRYAGVIVDVLYDHFLATGWDRYCSTGLDEFVGRVYENLARHAAVVPHPVPWIIGKMAAEDWLGSYRTAHGVDRTFRRISRRLRRENPLATAVEELERNGDLLRGHFHTFFPQALARFRPGRMPVSPQDGLERDLQGMRIAL